MTQPEPISSSVKFIRLNTGEDLASEVVYYKTDDDEYYVLLNPLKIVYSVSQSRPGYLSLSLLQWVLPEICSKQEFTIYPNDILTMSDASDEMDNYYWESLTKLTYLEQEKSSKKAMEDIDDMFDVEVDDSELSYVKEMLEEIKNGKRKLH
jgi:hypothetical protein